MRNYDFVEGTEFEGLMPHAIDANGGIGVKEDQPNVAYHGFKALGHDQLEIVDVAKFYEGGEGGESTDGGATSGTTGDTTSGTTGGN